MKGAASRGPLSYKLLERKPTSDQDSHAREMALYDGKSVLVEWKGVEREMESKLKHRIKTLATLLQDVNCAGFHSLSCLGYLKDPTSGNYGYIFQPPGKSQTYTFMSLAQVLSLDTLVPNLNDRIALAIALVETVLQLHTSGWLHKGLRSENILFFKEGADMIKLREAFLEGYEYARADNPSDMTESPALQQEANLYRHPSLVKKDRASFRKAYDLYALGCVLIEIGLWANLTTILLFFVRKEKSPGKGSLARLPSTNLDYGTRSEMAEVNKSRARLLTEEGVGSIREALEFAAGKTLANVVNLCLSAPKDDEYDDDEDDHCLDLELEILEKLRSCKV